MVSLAAGQWFRAHFSTPSGEPVVLGSAQPVRIAGDGGFILWRLQSRRKSRTECFLQSRERPHLGAVWSLTKREGKSPRTAWNRLIGLILVSTILYLQQVGYQD